MTDPLEEREDREIEVRDKRIVESMDRDAELNQMRRVLESDDARDVIWRVLTWGNIFSSVYEPNNSKMCVMEGRRQLCLQLLAEINLANPQAWLSMQLKSAEVAAAAEKAAALKRLRKGRST